MNREGPVLRNRIERALVALTQRDDIGNEDRLRAFSLSEQVRDKSSLKCVEHSMSLLSSYGVSIDDDSDDQ